MTSDTGKSKPSARSLSQAAASLAQWYASHERDVPWRIKDGTRPEPYHVWLSEIMCQQTTIAAVRPYYRRFLENWPDITALAAAQESEVMEAWAGLGYYARARNLHKCARQITNEHAGRFPENLEELKKLPGIGEYTAAAIAAFAFGQQTIIIDGNIERVMARLFAIQTPPAKAKNEIRQAAALFYSSSTHEAATLAQALMDLGASTCIAKTPRCGQCPLRPACQANKKNLQNTLPAKAQKKPKPQKHGYIYWIEHPKTGMILAQRRPPKGLLGGTKALPSGPWTTQDKPMEHAPEIGAMRINTPPHEDIPAISHTFTHFELKLYALAHRAGTKPEDPAFEWIEPERLRGTMPSVFEKAFVLLEKIKA